MADQKPTTSASVEDDELIHVPEGQSRLRYLLTIGLVIFLLVIFVVADSFQNALTGSSSGSADDVYLRWEDPISKETVELTRLEFQRTAQDLDLVSNLGAYIPPSTRYADQPRSSRRPEAEDVASFLIYDKIARDTGVEVADEELVAMVDMLGGKESLAGYAASRRRSVKDVAEAIRRVERVSRVQELIVSPYRVNDSSAAVEAWQKDNPEYKFQVVTLEAETLEPEARQAVPDDEELLRWFREDMSAVERAKLMTQPRVVPEVAFLDLADGAFDATALLEKFPLPEETDLEQLTEAYYNQNRLARFRKPKEESGEALTDAQIDQVDFYTLDEVRERAQREAELRFALDAFRIDVQDRRAADPESVDFTAEAAALGLDIPEIPAEGFERTTFPVDEAPWANQRLASMLMQAAEGALVPLAIVTEDGMSVARAADMIEPSEPDFADIRESVVDLWVSARAAELAVERLDDVRATLAVRPTDLPEGDEWLPTIDGTELKELANAAGYGWYERPYLARGVMPEGEAKPEDNFIRSGFMLYMMEPGQVATPQAERNGERAFLVRLDSTRDKPADKVTARDHQGYRSRVQNEQFREFGRQVFLGEGSWLAETAKIEWPTRDAIEEDPDEDPDDDTEG